jgi:hypothetical protein
MDIHRDIYRINSYHTVESVNYHISGELSERQTDEGKVGCGRLMGKKM